MPDQYAHTLFARRVYQALKPEFQAKFNVHSALFRCGCFGPDPLFNDLNGVRRREGFHLHHLSGADCMERMRGPVRGRMPFAVEYAAGFFCHYALDRICHPDILMRAARGDAPHVAMETAYDRMLLRRDPAPDVPRRLHLTDDMCRAATEMYESVSPKQFRADVNAFWKLRRMLIFGGGTPLAGVAGKLNAKWDGIIPRSRPTPVLVDAFHALDHLIDENVEPVARELEKLLTALERNLPFDPWLDEDFSGRRVETEARVEKRAQV